MRAVDLYKENKMNPLKFLLSAVAFAFMGTLFVLMAIVTVLGLLLNPLIGQNKDYQSF